MKIKDFFKNTKKTLGIKTCDDDEMSKKKKLEALLKKLTKSKLKIKEDLKKSDISYEEKIELEEELNIYNIQIKKGEEILERKNNK